MLNTVSSLLIFTLILSSPVVGDVQFNLLSLGVRFVSTNPSTLLANISAIEKPIYCAVQCMNNIRCLTANHDRSTRRCSLFSAWLFEGSTSLSSTSQVLFIPQQTTFYTAYHQPCTSLSYDPINRYMQCVSVVWVCPNRYFFNDSVCVHQGSFNMSCQNDDWCDSFLYLTCSNSSETCQCNSSMNWNGSQCTPTCSSGYMGVSFNDLTAPTVIPDGYAGFVWSNLQVCTVNYDQRACNRNTSSISFTRMNGTFLLQEMVFGVSAPNITLRFYKKKNDTTVYSGSYLMAGSSFIILSLNWNNLDGLVITSTPQPQTPIINIDGICYST